MDIQEKIEKVLNEFKRVRPQDDDQDLLEHLQQIDTSITTIRKSLAKKGFKGKEARQLKQMHLDLIDFLEELTLSFSF